MLKRTFLYNSIVNKFIQFPDKLIFRWWILVPVTFLILFSLTTLKYTSLESSINSSTFVKQLIWFIIGCIVFISCQWLRIQFFQEYAYHFYVILILFIGLTYLMPAVGGAHRWIPMGFFSFQPSELGKLILVFSLARLLSSKQDSTNEIKLLILALLLGTMPALMIFLQPDFGTAIVYAFIVIPMLFWSGIKLFYLFVVIAPIISIVSAFNIIFFSIWMGLLLFVLYISQPKVFYGVVHFIINIGCGILSPYVWNSILYPHHRDRILTLLNPMRDPHGSGYQVIQSIIAIGSGGVWGKGLGEGTQTQLRYLPVRDTDFIVSVIAEEWGLFGVAIILVSFFILLYWIIIYAGSISSEFSSLSLIGFSSILFIHLIVNMGMTVGLLPVTGLPAPFLSYGGSFLLTCLLILSFVNNIVNYHVK